MPKSVCIADLIAIAKTALFIPTMLHAYFFQVCCNWYKMEDQDESEFTGKQAERDRILS